MKKIMTSLAFIAISISASAQTKDTFVLKSFPTYDEFGNYYEVVKSFDHIPTSKDSANFKKESRAQIHAIIDSVRKTYYVPPVKSVKRPIKKKN